MDSSISLETIASQEVLIVLASFGTLAVASALRPSAVIMMKCLMLALTAREISWQLQVLMVLPEYIMCLRVLASRCYRVTRMKSLRFLSTLRATKSSPQAAIRPADYGL